jgi:hypothetical protein
MYSQYSNNNNKKILKKGLENLKNVIGIATLRVREGLEERRLEQKWRLTTLYRKLI